MADDLLMGWVINDSMAKNEPMSILRANQCLKIHTTAAISRNIRLLLAEPGIDHVLDSGNGDRRLRYISC
jgi:hypothetical protein